ncbi:MAG: hypothetical protein ACTSWL_09045, partial [Promethearchaeota archaeon]
IFFLLSFPFSKKKRVFILFRNAISTSGEPAIRKNIFICVSSKYNKNSENKKRTFPKYNLENLGIIYTLFVIRGKIVGVY